jgi:hypothetical protein
MELPNSGGSLFETAPHPSIAQEHPSSVIYPAHLLPRVLTPPTDTASSVNPLADGAHERGPLAHANTLASAINVVQSLMKELDTIENSKGADSLTRKALVAVRQVYDHLERFGKFHWLAAPMEDLLKSCREDLWRYRAEAIEHATWLSSGIRITIAKDRPTKSGEADEGDCGYFHTSCLGPRNPDRRDGTVSDLSDRRGQPG